MEAESPDMSILLKKVQAIMFYVRIVEMVMRRVVLLLVVVSSSVAWAGEFEDGEAAYKRED